MSTGVKQVGTHQFVCANSGYYSMEIVGYDDGELELRVETDDGTERIVMAEQDVDELRVLLLRITLVQGRRDRS